MLTVKATFWPWPRIRQSRPHIRQSRPASGLGLQATVLKTFQVFPSSLGSGWTFQSNQGPWAHPPAREQASAAQSHPSAIHPRPHFCLGGSLTGKHRPWWGGDTSFLSLRSWPMVLGSVRNAFSCPHTPKFSNLSRPYPDIRASSHPVVSG